LKALVLSYFDPIVGPKILLKVPESIENKDLDVIPSLMDVYEEKFFVHITETIKSANLIFEIQNPYSRGKIELFQISIVSGINSKINLNLAHELLEAFISEFNQIDEVYKAFYIDFEKSKEKNKKFEELKNFFDNFYKSIRPAVRALKSAELRYQTLFKSARDAILIIDKKTSNIVDANIMAEKLFGKTRSEIINKNAAMFSYSEEFEKIKSYLMELINEENAPPKELKIIKSNGIEIPVEINASQIRMGGQDLILIIMRDITERKIAEKKLTDAYDRADFYKDLFAYDMNHILNNINATTEIFSQYLKDTNIEADKYDLLRQIKEQSLKGLNLILYVQKVLGIEGLDIAIEKIEINKILKEAVTFLSNNFFERLLEINLEPIANTSELYIMANMLLLNVFESILLNAAQHNDKPLVSIKIKVSRIKKDDKSYFKIEFLDNGKGIPDNLKGTIFQKDRKIDEGFIGMGLGLYIVKKILSNYNGQIWIENRIKDDYTKGSNFIVLLLEANN